jgi:hypothetical protein
MLLERAIVGMMRGLALNGLVIAVDDEQWLNSGGNTVTEVNPSDGSVVQVLSGGRYGFNDPEGMAFLPQRFPRQTDAVLLTGTGEFFAPSRVSGEAEGGC